MYWIQSVNPRFYVTLYYIMDVRIFVIAEWATLLVDILCPRGGSQLNIPIHFSSLAALICADIARNL